MEVSVDKIFKILLWIVFFETLVSGIIVFYFVRIGLADDDVDVSPKYIYVKFPGTYVYEFCFYNRMSRNITFETISSDVLVQYLKLTIPRKSNCVKERLTIIVSNPGKFFIIAKDGQFEKRIEINVNFTSDNPNIQHISIIDIAKIVLMIGVIVGLIYFFIYIIQII